MVQSFGKVTVAAAGTPSRLTVNQVDPAKKVGLQTVMVQALPTNTGVVYVYHSPDGTPGDIRASLTKCVAILAAPASATTGPFPSASFSVPSAVTALDLSEFWIDVSVNGEGVVVTGAHNEAGIY